MAGHDWNDKHPGVAKAATEVFIDAGCDVRIFGSVWMITNAEYRRAIDGAKADRDVPVDA